MSEHVHLIPEWFWFAGTTAGTKTHVWVKPSARAYALPHERVHLRQARILGRLRFLWRWLTSPRWRIRLEAEAYAENVALGHMTLDYAARLLSGPLYWNACSYDAARAEIAGWLSPLRIVR